MENSLLRFTLSLEDFEKIDQYRRSHRVAILTMVLTDIVGYSTLCERISDARLMDILNDFESFTAFHFEENRGGLIVKRIGDAALMIFAEPVSAVIASLEYNKNLKEKEFSGMKLQARTGIHMGQVTVEQKGIHVDIFGRHVNRVARVQAAADPEEILVTDVVEDNVRAWVENEKAIKFFRRRALMLKGIENPVSVFTVESTKSEESQEYSLPDTYITIDVRGEVSGVSKTLTFYPLHDTRILIGRGARCDLRLDDRTVSRTHAMIVFYNDQGWVLQDLSSGRVSLNGQPVSEAILNTDDQITIGKTEIIISGMSANTLPPEDLLCTLSVL